MPISTTRRTILAGLAAAPVAALPGAASAVVDADPFCAALAELRVLRAREAAAHEAYRRAEAAFDHDMSSIGGRGVVFGGVEFLTVERFDHECRSGVLSLFAREPRMAELRAELERRSEAAKASMRRHGCDEAREDWELADEDLYDAVDRALDTTPTTPAGAIGLIRLVRDIIDRRNGSYGSEEEDAASCRALDRALAVLEPLPDFGERL
jgi:hypothetical protein